MYTFSKEKCYHPGINYQDQIIPLCVVGKCSLKERSSVSEQIILLYSPENDIIRAKYDLKVERRKIEIVYKIS